jgi:hypothetical protein
LKTENDVGGVPPQSIQENSLKKENASVARKGLMHFCFVRLFCHSPIEIALDADFFVTKQLL